MQRVEYYVQCNFASTLYDNDIIVITGTCVDKISVCFAVFYFKVVMCFYR